MNIDQAKRRLQQRIETMNKLRGRPLTDRERLDNLKRFLAKEESGQGDADREFGG